MDGKWMEKSVRVEQSLIEIVSVSESEAIFRWIINLD